MEVSKMKHFWEWFQQHSEIVRYLNMIDQEEVGYWMNEVVVHLWACSENVNACMLLPTDGTTATLIISAGGVYEYFEQVEEIVAEAPQIPGWEIIAFEPPNPIDMGIEEEFGHTGIDPHNLWFDPILCDWDERPYILVYAEGYKMKDPEFEAAVAAVMANLLGERSATLDIAEFAVNDLNMFSADEREGLMKLQELPAYLERTKLSSIVINEQGKLEEKSRMTKK